MSLSFAEITELACKQMRQNMIDRIMADSPLLSLLPPPKPTTRWQRFKNGWSWRITSTTSRLSLAWRVLKTGDCGCDPY